MVAVFFLLCLGCGVVMEVRAVNGLERGSVANQPYGTNFAAADIKVTCRI
jgi:hypothetical protein